MGVQERKAREFDRREREILDAALLLFRRVDWETVTIEQIAEQVEISRGTVYKHFGTKDQLYARLALGFQRSVLEAWRRIDPELPVLDRMRAVLRVVWDAHLVSRELHRVVLHCLRPEFRQNLPPATAREFEIVDAAFGEVLAGLLSEGIERGLFPARPIEVLMVGPRAAFWGAIQLAWSSRLAAGDRDRYFDELSRFMLAGLIHQDLPSEATAGAARRTQ
jgi:AcrR family transcriptional regulator